MKAGSYPEDMGPEKGSGNFRVRLSAQVLILGLVVLMMHSSGLWRGRMLDDFFILDKCKTMPLGDLLAGGLTIRREEAGDFWWIDQDTILSYFRPLLVLTYKLPGLVTKHPDFWQHLINLLFHLGTVLLVLAAARRLTRDPKSSFLAALFFAVSVHHLLAVQWISGRKEPMIGLFLILAFFLHLKGQRACASLAFLGALLTGEQSLAFPVMALLWDILGPEPRPEGETGSARKIRGGLPAWALYFGILVLYLVFRALIFRGPGSPVSPYYSSPLSFGNIPQTLFKIILFLFSLTLSAPYVDQVIVERWINSPVFFGLSVLLIALVILVMLAPVRRRRASLTLFILAVVSYLPFLPMAALPYYLYTPSLFFALAVGAGLADRSRTSSSAKAGPGRGLPLLVIGLMILNAATGMILSWTSSGDYFKLPPGTLYLTAGLLEKIPKDRNVLLVDVPADYIPAFFHFDKLLAEFTGRDPRSLAFITDRPGGSDSSSSQWTPLGPSGFRIHSTGRPYFNSPGGRLMWLFPERNLEPGKTFSRGWYSVTIRKLAPETKPFNRGHRFFSKKEGITDLDVTLKEGALPPLVISFLNKTPYILVDMKENPYEAALPPDPVSGQSDFLLHALAGRKGIPPPALKMPDRLVPKAGPKMGLGPLLQDMSERIPVFRRAYFQFLRYLDELNAQMQRAGGGAYRQEASNIGLEYYARAIEAMGGMSHVTVRSNELGITWDSIMEKARVLADKSLDEEKVDLSEADRMMLVNLLALAQIASVTNQIIPADYLTEWESRHPERPRPPETPPQDIPKVYWEGVRKSIPWMYHSGALPERDGASSNPHEAFDSYHFFSHAWIAAYGLYRYRYVLDGPLKSKFTRREPGRWAVEEELARSKLASLGQEILTLAVKQGFFEATRTEFLPGFLQGFCRFFKLQGFPLVESFRDMEVGNEGAVYGAALAVSGLPLKPSEGRLHRRIIDDL